MRLLVIISAACISASLFSGCGRLAVSERRSPNILLVTIDTFRADRLGVGVAPALDRLAASGIRFTNARAAAPLTLPSHTTILTGLLPPAHGVRENGVDALGESHPTIALLLKDHGYITAAFVGAFVLDRRFGLARGFDTYDDRIQRDPAATERLEAERPAVAVVDRALEWLEATDRGRGSEHQAPLFVWIHLYDPHAPYNPPREFIRTTASNPGDTERYEGEIAYADSQIARVFDWIRTHALADNTLIVVGGDHGEGLGDHGERTHGMLLYDSTLRVPLVISAPGRPRAIRDDPVSLVDIAPTILRAAGVTPPDAMKGQDLLQRTAMPVKDATVDLYSETEYPRVAGWSPLQALTDGRWKAIHAVGTTELYDLETDPWEQHDAAASQPSIVAALAARMDAIHAPALPAMSATVSPEAQERLRALGYVGGSVQTSGMSSAPNPAMRIGTWNQFEDALAALNARRPDALPSLARLAAANRDAAVFQTSHARALKESGQLKAALTAYREAGRRWPTDASLLHDLASAARAAGRLDEAKRVEQAAIALAPSSATVQNGTGLIAIDEGRLPDAARAFERATALDPNNATYWGNLGNAKRAVHDSIGAGQAYRHALDIDSRNVDAANGLGVLLVEAQRPGEALPWFERAIAAAPDFIEARLNLGIALQQSGQTSRAADAYRAVLGTAGSHPREKNAAAKLLTALGTSR